MWARILWGRKISQWLGAAMLTNRKCLFESEFYVSYETYIATLLTRRCFCKGHIVPSRCVHIYCCSVNFRSWSLREGDRFPHAYFVSSSIWLHRFAAFNNRKLLALNVTFVWVVLHTSLYIEIMDLFFVCETLPKFAQCFCTKPCQWCVNDIAIFAEERRRNVSMFIQWKSMGLSVV